MCDTSRHFLKLSADDRYQIHGVMKVDGVYAKITPTYGQQLSVGLV